MNENDYYRDFCLACTKYAFAIYSDNESDNEMANLCQQTINRINGFYESGKYKMLKTQYNFILEEAVHWPEFLIENHQYYLDNYGINILELDKKRLNRIAKILERAKIKTDNEFRLISEHVDELCQTNGNPELIGKFNTILLDYEERAEAKLRKRKK